MDSFASIATPMIEPLPNRQQNYVSRVIQGSLLRQFAGFWAAYFCLLWHGMFLWEFLRSPEGASLTFWEKYWNFSRNHVDLAVCAVAILPVFYWKALRLTHRIAGPLERFRRSLERLERGEAVPPVTLRRDDLLIEYQRAFNRYLAHLERENSRPASTRAEPETDPADHPLIREMESLTAEIRQVASPAEE